MQPPPIPLRAERGIADVANATFVFLRQNAVVLAKVLVVVVAPFTVGSMLSMSGFFLGMLHFVDPSAADGMADPDMGGILAMLGAYAGMALFSLLAGVAALTAVYSFMLLYAERGPGAVEPVDVFRRMRTYVWRVLGLVLLFAACAGLSIFVLIVPFLGILVWYAILAYLGVLAAIACPAMFWEDASIAEAIARARTLVRDRWWRTAGAILLVWMLYSVIGGLFQFPTLIALGVGLFQAAEGGGAGSVVQALVLLFSAVGGVGMAVLYAIPAVGVGLQYLSLVEEHEAVGLRERVAAMARATPPAPAATPPPLRPTTPPSAPAPTSDDGDRWAPPGS